jgi:hypothetical protein
MSSTTRAAAFKPTTTTPDAARLLRELFEATPLYIFWTAAREALKKSSAR